MVLAGGKKGTGKPQDFAESWTKLELALPMKDPKSFYGKVWPPLCIAVESFV